MNELKNIKYQNLYKLISVLICLCLILVFIIPSAYVFTMHSEENDGVWVTTYLYEDYYILLFLFPFYVLYPLTLVVKHKIALLLILTAAFVNAFILGLIGLLLSNSFMDYSGYYGSLVLVFLLPLLIVQSIIRVYLTKR